MTVAATHSEVPSSFESIKKIIERGGDEPTKTQALMMLNSCSTKGCSGRHHFRQMLVLRMLLLAVTTGQASAGLGCYEFGIISSGYALLGVTDKCWVKEINEEFNGKLDDCYGRAGIVSCVQCT